MNRSATTQKLNFDWKTENIYDSVSKQQFDKSTSYKIYDVWAKKEIGTTSNTLTTEVPSHDVLMIRLSK